MAPADANREALPNRIGDRYRVEKLLGTGGMALVYLVFDEQRERHVALKRLQPQAAPSTMSEGDGAALVRDDDETQAAPVIPPATTHAGHLFEREFDTLSQLVHPRIVEVYDYHRDAIGPYYTMELLDGGDLRERSPVHWREACKVLCDVCSAISLLHSRRLVHRDLTPLNIRCTRDGNAKLFDFGSMTSVGRSRHVVGTPPFVAPEALHGEIVDAQTDLFALGATAYYALTGKHAYPARQLLALPDAWLQPPPPPSHHVPGIPAALDELVLWLLQLAPSARPPSAAEVMERLSAIGGFDLREAIVVRQSYLATPVLVGRESSLDRIRNRLRAAADADGGALIVSGPPGSGRTRLLDACVLEARLLGAIVLRADERDGSARWGVAGALVRQLVAQAPELALPAAHQHAASLVHLLPEVDPSWRANAPDADAVGEQAFRSRAQTALRDLMFEVADRRLSIVVVDDVDRIDEPSAAFLALIAHELRRRRVLLIASIGRTEQRSASALSWLLHAGESIRLRQLSPAQTELLVRSLFGETPNVRLAADRIYTASRGNPGAIMQIARQLVASGQAHYAAGTWTLPSEIDACDLALALHASASFDPNVRPSALELARAIAACEGARLTFRECLKLSSHGDARRLNSELDELGSAGIVSRHAEHYFVAGEGLRAALLRDLDPQHARGLHARVAGFYEHRRDQPVRVALHCFRGGDVSVALDVLLAELRARRIAAGDAFDPVALFEYVQSMPNGWQEMYRGLIAAAAGRSRRDRLDLQLAFLAFTAVTAGYEPACLRDVIAQLRFDTGLDLYSETSAALAPTARLVRALAACEARWDRTPEVERGLPLKEAIPALVQVMVHAIGTASRALDHGLLAALPSLEPLFPLSAALAVVQQNVDATRDLLAGRVLRALDGNRRALELLAADGGVAGMSQANLELTRLALHWSSGIVEANFGDPAALARAGTIEPSPLFAVNAWRVRALFSLFQGDLQAAERCRVQTELLQIQNSPPQLFEGSHRWQMVLGYFAAHDLLRTKQCIADLEAMARQFEPWKPAVLFARGAYQTLRGDGALGLAEFERALSLLELGQHVAWAACAGGVLLALNVQGRYDESARRGYEMLDRMRAADGCDLEFFVTLPLAHAEIERRKLSAAASLLASVIEMHEGPGRRNVYLGRAYELRARLALYANDAPEFQRALALCSQQYAPSRNSQLRGKLDQLKRAAREAGLLPEPISLGSRGRDAETDGGSTVATVLSSCDETQERVERALLLLTRHSRCTGGFLYTLRTEGPALVARRGNREPLPQLDALVNRFVATHATPRELTRSQYLTTTGTEPRASWRAPDGTQFVPMLLTHRSEVGPCITGVAVMWLRPEANYRVPTRLLTALSRTLHESGDTMTLVPDWSTN